MRAPTYAIDDDVWQALWEMPLPRATPVKIVVTCLARPVVVGGSWMHRLLARAALPINHWACRHVEWAIKRHADALTAACVAEDWPRARDIEEAMGADEKYLRQLRIDGERLRRDAEVGR